MQDRPVIKTAIPKRRYQIGDFGASLLGDIESDGAHEYRYILAFVPLGQGQPTFYVCSQLAAQTAPGAGRYALRVVNEVMSEVVDTGDQWGDMDTFADQALKLGVQALGLQQEQVMRLL
jgi:hypothetical protein